MTYSVNMVDPVDPVFEVAAARVVRMVRGNKKFIDAIIKATPAEREKNWKLTLVKKHADFKYIKGRIQKDAEFRAYLVKHLTEAFTEQFAEDVIKVFSE